MSFRVLERLAATASGVKRWLVTDQSPEDLAIAHLSQAYLILLRMPHGGVRARSQKCLAELRDAIARELGDDEEATQNFYEYWEQHGGPPPKNTVPETAETSTPPTT